MQGFLAATLSKSPIPPPKTYSCRTLLEKLTCCLVVFAWAEWRLVTLIVEAIHGKVGKGARAAEFLTSSFSPVHLVDPFGCLLWKLLRVWMKHLRKEPCISEHLAAAFRSNPRNKGPLACLVYFWREMGMRYSEEDDAYFLHGVQIDVLGEPWNEKTQHEWRQRIRAHFERTLAARRTDMLDLHNVDHKALMRQQKQWNGPPAALLRGIQAGGTTTPDRVARQAYGERVRCPCGQGLANFAHIMWDCPLVDSCRTLRQPDDFSNPEQVCAIPILGTSPSVQDALAKQAIQTLMRWKELHPKGHDTGNDGNDDGDDGGPCVEGNQHTSLPTPDACDDDGPPPGWGRHPKEECLWLSPDGLRIMCTSCRTEARSDGIKRHVRKHAQCTYARRVTPNGRVPKALPKHLVWQKGEDGVRHIHCLRCCARAHFTKRSTFVGRHTFCAPVCSSPTDLRR